MKPAPLRSVFGRHRPRGFTLTEVIFAASISVAVLAVLASITIIFARVSYKNAMLADGTAETRRVQEHLGKELSAAVTQSNSSDPTASIRPEFSIPSSTTPVRYARMTYRTAIGAYATAEGTTLSGNSTITLKCPADLQPQAGDWIVIEAPNLGKGRQIVSFSDSRSPGSSGSVTFSLASSIAAGDVKPDTVAIIQRESAYETTTPASGSTITELRWYPTTASTEYLVLSSRVDAAERYLFAQIPDDPTATEVTVSWQFTYRADDRTRSAPPGGSDFLERNFAAGLIFPKSGNPLAMAPIAGISTSISTTSTSTTSTSTSTTSSTTSASTSKSTTSASTSKSTTSASTSKSTTTASTSKSTTSASTSKSTSSASTSKTTSTATTSKSTTSASTTKSTSKSTTTATTSKSTTSKSTTAKSTSKSTSKSTTAKSTSKSTSSATTSKSTTAASTSKSTSSASTSKSTTSASTSKSTTSASTSKSTTTASTSKSTSTATTTKATTSTIPFDG